MTTSPLYISRNDHLQLRRLVGAVPRARATVTVEKLRAELDRATIIDPAAMPTDIVTMGSRVKVEDLYTGEIEEYTLTFPDQADIGAGRLSILTPIGTALLGYREGNVLDWPTPGGIRRLKIHQVTPRGELLPATTG